MKNKIILYLNILFAGLVLTTGFAFATGSWSAPTANPPGNNAELPLNGSDYGQTKKAGLTLNTSGFPTGLVIDKGTLQISALASASCIVNNKVISTDASGVVTCVTAPFATESNHSKTSDSATTAGSAGSATNATYATNLAGGTAGQIPYQSAPSVTTFDNALKWVKTGSPSVFPYTNDTLTLIGGHEYVSTVNDTAILGESGNSYGVWGYSHNSIGVFATGLIYGIDGSSSAAVQPGIPNPSGARFKGSGSLTTYISNNNGGYSVDGNGPISGTQYCISRANCISGWKSTWTSGDAVNLVMRDASGNFAANNITAANTITANKLTVNTVDPVYTIGGVNYATYMPGMTGVKEETTGTLTLSGNKYVVDLNNLSEGSDLWLFSKATNLKNNLSKLTIILTPSFDGRVWYAKDLVNNKLTIYGSPANSSQLTAISYEVSYRLTAPRFDSASWTNYNHDIGVSGLTINN